MKQNISIIIPAYNSERVIARVLDALYKEQLCAEKQVIVVDGYSKDSTVAIARKYPVELYFNPKVHAAAARNIGLKAAKGDIIAFTDSDCVPDEKWLQKIVASFENNPEIIGVGGRLIPLNPKNNIEKFAGNVFINEIMRFPDQSFKPSRKFLPGSFITSNCAYKKYALTKVNGFNEFFANNGEDIDLFWRMMNASPGLLLYDPAIIVYHSFPDTYIGLVKKYLQYGLASSKLARFHLKTPCIDLLLYKKLINHFLKLVNPLVPNKKNNYLYLMQLSSHLLGKVYGSFVTKRVNL